MLSEWTEGAAVREFSYDAAGRMIEATIFTLTTRFTYNGLGARVAVEVVGQETTTFTLDYAAGNRILAEATLAGAVHYLYGRDCLGELRDDEWLYYLNDATGYVRQGVDDQEQVMSGWLFDPDGVVLEGPEGPVSHLVCGGVYDWSTGLIYKGGRYFDPMLGIWLALMPLVVVQSWRGRKKRRGFPWYVMVLLVVCVSGVLTACGEEGDTPNPTVMCTPIPPSSGTPEPPPDDGAGCEGECADAQIKLAETEIVCGAKQCSKAMVAAFWLPGRSKEEFKDNCVVIQWASGKATVDGELQTCDGPDCDGGAQGSCPPGGNCITLSTPNWWHVDQWRNDDAASQLFDLPASQTLEGWKFWENEGMKVPDVPDNASAVYTHDLPMIKSDKLIGSQVIEADVEFVIAVYNKNTPGLPKRGGDLGFPESPPPCNKREWNFKTGAYTTR
jgi:hypothetical protein